MSTSDLPAEPAAPGPTAPALPTVQAPASPTSGATTAPAAHTGRARAWAWAWGAGWGHVAQLVLDLVLSPGYLTIALLFGIGLVLVPVFGVGLLMVVPLLPVCQALGMLERLRLQAFTGVVVPPAPRRSPDAPRWRRLLLDRRPWFAVLHLTFVGLWGMLAGLVVTVLTWVAVPLALLPAYGWALPATPLLDVVPWTPVWLTLLGILLTAALPYLARGLVQADVLLAQTLLGPGRQTEVDQLTRRVETLTTTREMALDSAEVERRRIERDLHDGPQQRLVSIAMDLGMARARLAEDPDRAQDLLDKAHLSAKEAIVEMRQVARGIHPPVLTDRGLDAALSALAARSPVPVDVRVEPGERPDPAVEAIAYYAVSEALTNVAKHAGASRASVTVRRIGGTLQVQVADDGRGGADPTRGTGLTGLRQRLAAVDGALTVHSPPGGGTTIAMTLPLRSGTGRAAGAPAPHDPGSPS